MGTLHTQGKLHPNITFTIIYPNRRGVRAKVERMVLRVQDSVDFSRAVFTMPGVFRAQPNWPSKQQLADLPLHAQCEFVELQADRLLCKKKFVINI